MKVNLGGQRLGSGNKMSLRLKNYERSTHDLSRVWRSTMAPGVLVPCFIEPSLPHDTWDVDLTTLVRTLPTNGPIFGSFKMQIDAFTIPIRLYNAQLHNDKLGIGKEMENVKFPMMHLMASDLNPEESAMNQQQISQSSLLAYTGTRGLGKSTTPVGGNQIQRYINAMPLLMYWDIYKNYYANKQEEIGVVIDPEIILKEATVDRVLYKEADWDEYRPIDNTQATFQMKQNGSIKITGTGVKGHNIWIQVNGTGRQLWGASLFRDYKETIRDNGNNEIEFTGQNNSTYTIQNFSGTGTLFFIQEDDVPSIEGLSLSEFPLSNIDDMRENLLKAPNTSPYIIGYETNEQRGLPYDVTTHAEIAQGRVINKSKFPLAGLGVKTYQSDRFNNWLSTEWIDGPNGISAITAVDTSSGSFTIDQLNLQQKVYEMLNRIAVSGGSYHDWQEAVWGEEISRKPESPIYVGGLSSEITFNEVVSTADATANGNEQPLGTLAGKGVSSNIKGSTIRIKTNEPSYLMFIVSLTPRIDYSQGNKWWTRLETMDDFHKPQLDGIGFQELITDEMAAFDTVINGTTPVYKSAGKQTAWIEYQTAVNECYGNFANENSEMFMTLNRRYSHDENGNISDLTTYIDPSKYNYAFANTKLDAQNFWVQIGIDAIARKKMSAKQIPNL